MKRITFILAALLMTLLVKAAPALRLPITVTQPDGSTLTIEQFGDEHHHWTATTDGAMVVNTGHGYYVAQVNEQGELEATGVLAHEVHRRSSQEQALIDRQASRRGLFHEKGQQALRRAMNIGSGYSYLPHQGDVRILCILAQYQDVQFTVNEPQKAFHQLLNGNTQEDLGNQNNLNKASVRQYFETSSHGQFSPQFDVVGPVTLPDTMGYYGGKSSTPGDDKFSTFCKDALAKVKEENLVSDWSLYDNATPHSDQRSENDGDGKTVELICIIFAGYGQNQGGGNNTIWAKAGYQGIKVNDQYTVSFFNCSCEKFHPSSSYSNYINGTGVFIHEMSHCMGLPDLYATTANAYVNNQGMGPWDIMDYGIYNYNGFAPSLYTAWEQEVMGWTTIEPVTDASQITNLKPLEDGGKSYKIVNATPHSDQRSENATPHSDQRSENPDNDRDYIVLENIQQSGLNAHAYGHGLLVYHVAYPYSKVNMGDAPNNTPGRPAVAVVPAGGTLICKNLSGSGEKYTNDEWKASVAASTFPGTKGVTTLNDGMNLPNYCFYDSSSSAPGLSSNRAATGTKSVGLTLNDITESESGVSLQVSVPTGIEEIKMEGDHQRESDGEEKPIFNLAGQQVTTPTRGLYIRNGRKYLLK